MNHNVKRIYLYLLSYNYTVERQSETAYGLFMPHLKEQQIFLRGPGKRDGTSVDCINLIPTHLK